MNIGERMKQIREEKGLTQNEVAQRAGVTAASLSRWENKEIGKLPVEKIADKDAVLFMWVTFPCLKEGLKVIEEWGFTYKTVAFNWVKQNKKGAGLFWGLGFWTRSNSEICLLATKGRPKRISASVHSVIMSPVQKHSKKPEEAKQRIVELMGDLPRIELFAREVSPGWDAWGNEVSKEERGQNES